QARLSEQFGGPAVFFAGTFGAEQFEAGDPACKQFEAIQPVAKQSVLAAEGVGNETKPALALNLADSAVEVSGKNGLLEKQADEVRAVVESLFLPDDELQWQLEGAGAPFKFRGAFDRIVVGDRQCVKSDARGGLYQRI